MDSAQSLATLYLNLWSGEKGGVGKSFCCGMDCQRHIDRNQPFYLIDADKKNATVRSYYGDYALDKDVFFSEAPERASTANWLLEAATKRPVVANCRAGTLDSLLTWVEQKQVVPIARQQGVQLRYFFVSDLEHASLNLFPVTAEQVAPLMPIIFVANYGCNRTDDSYFQSAGFQGLLAQYEVPVVKVNLFDLEMRKVMDGRNPEGHLMTWGEAQSYGEFGILGQSEVQLFLESFYEQLDAAERFADLAFSNRTSSPSVNGGKAKGVSASARKRNSGDG
ncbi:MAG: hypothetical protein WCA07_10835 [Gloeobacterales cyanobacterium]